MSLLYLREHFFTGDIRFLTFKGVKPKEQKIGFVNDKCRAISSTYVIVRELNKKTEGFHFHALLKVSKPPKDSWFIKGTHMNLQKVGKRLTVNTRALNLKEVLEYSDLCPEMKQTLMAEQMEEPRITKLIDESVRLHQHVDRALRYMSKELPTLPVQYNDYIICLRGKMHPIQEGRVSNPLGMRQPALPP